MSRRLLVNKKIFTGLVSLEHLQHVLGVLGAVVLVVGVLDVPGVGDVVDGKEGGAGVAFGCAGIVLGGAWVALDVLCFIIGDSCVGWSPPSFQTIFVYRSHL